MSISTLAELKTALNNWSKRSDLASYAEDLIMLGEKWIFRNVRAREMETALSGTIASGVLAVPTAFRALKHARIDASPNVVLQIKPAQWIYENYPTRSNGGTPKFIAVDGSNFIFGPYPSNLSVAGTYYAALTSVITSANALFLAHPDLYLFAALSELEPFLKNDKRVSLWMGKRDEIKNDINKEAMQGRYGDGMAVSAVS